MASMLIVNQHEGEKILNGEKTSSLRKINPNGKGYFKLGRLYWVCQGRDFKGGKLCKVIILNVSFVNIDDLAPGDFKSLGYSSKGEYLAQPYNKKNPSKDRVKYDFMTLSDFAQFVESLEICPENFRYVWEMVKDCKQLANGVNPNLIYEGCDLEDLIEEYFKIQFNIWELL